jgi:signal transduction histidine kinase
VGKLAAGVAHELGTPMNVILGRAKLVSSGEVKGEAALKSARIIGEQIEAMMRIIRQLLDFASRKQPQRTQADAVELLTQTTTLLEPMAKKRGVSIEVQPAGAPVEICADPAAMQQVLNNLVVNAVHATSRGGKVTLGVAKGPATSPAGVNLSTVQLSVRDTGHGLSPEVKEHLFEPFFTTKEVGQGTGLGLAVSWGIVEDHGGWISAESEPGRGAIFTVHLPEAAA